MQLTLEDWILWAAGFAGVAVLLAVLLIRGAARVFPWFTAWCFYQVCDTVVLFCLNSTGHEKMYSKVFWYGQIPELLLQLAVIMNMALLLFRLGGQWIAGTKPVALIGAGFSIFCACLLTLVAAPHAPTTLWSWLIRGNLFSAVLTTELSLAVIATAFFLGLSWRRWVTGMAIGLILRFSVAFWVEGAHTYFGVGPLYKALDHIRMYAEIAALVYWIVLFSRKEPARRLLTAEMIETLTRLSGSNR